MFDTPGIDIAGAESLHLGDTGSCFSYSIFWVCFLEVLVFSVCISPTHHPSLLETHMELVKLGDVWPPSLGKVGTWVTVPVPKLKQHQLPVTCRVYLLQNSKQHKQDSIPGPDGRVFHVQGKGDVSMGTERGTWLSGVAPSTPKWYGANKHLWGWKVFLSLVATWPQSGHRFTVTPRTVWYLIKSRWQC